MPRFEYARAHSIAEALELLGDPGLVSRPLAGGTDLLVYLRHERPAFDRLIDISRVAEMKRIEQQGGRILVGAAVTFTEAADSPLLRRVAGCLAEAAHSVGGPAIRNAATLGGNIANAAPCADSLPALICLDAAAHLIGPSGERDVPVSDLVLGPHRTDIRPGELLSHFSFAVPPSGARSAFLKLGRRNAQAISRLSMAALGRAGTDGLVEIAHLVPGAATPRTRRFTEVEALLLGRHVSSELLAGAAQATSDLMLSTTGRRWSTQYKEVAIQALADRALRRVLC